MPLFTGGPQIASELNGEGRERGGISHLLEHVLILERQERQIPGYYTIPSSASYHAGQSLLNYQNNAVDLAQYEPTTAKKTKQMDIVSHIKLGVLTFLSHHGSLSHRHHLATSHHWK